MDFDDLNAHCLEAQGTSHICEKGKCKFHKFVLSHDCEGMDDHDGQGGYCEEPVCHIRDMAHALEAYSSVKSKGGNSKDDEYDMLADPLDLFSDDDD